jgi:hypothetical protein
VFAVDVGGATESLTWVGVGLVVAAVIWSVILMEPLNSKFRKLPEGTAPEGLDAIRELWRRRHLARTLVAVCAICCFAVAVTGP